MSTRFKNGSHYENHQRAAEMHEGAEHAHNSAGQHGSQEHLTGHEESRNAMEHSPSVHDHAPTATVGHGIAAFGHKEIAALAYELWEARGCPEGSPEEDWSQAVEQLRSRAVSH
jgi:Protein of unknown function (DUF2934)